MDAQMNTSKKYPLSLHRTLSKNISKKVLKEKYSVASKKPKNPEV